MQSALNGDATRSAKVPNPLGTMFFNQACSSQGGINLPDTRQKNVRKGGHCRCLLFDGDQDKIIHGSSKVSQLGLPV